MSCNRPAGLGRGGNKVGQEMDQEGTKGVRGEVPLPLQVVQGRTSGPSSTLPPTRPRPPRMDRGVREEHLGS